MVVLEENKRDYIKISITNILDDFNLGSIDANTYIESILESNEFYNLDLFPKVVSNYKKYTAVEVFYQKVLDREITVKEFEKNEQKYHQLIKTLWLYDDMYIALSNDATSIFNSSYARTIKKKLKNAKKFLVNIANDKNNAYLIDTYEMLNTVLYIGTREISPILFCFIGLKVLIYLDGCSGVIFFGNEFEKQNILDIIKASQLWIINRDIL